MKGLRKWRWGELPAYNGFTHSERVRGWQLIMWRIDNGWAERGATCCISNSTVMPRLHSEDYYSWQPYTLNHSIHIALHQRFKRPDAWRRIVDQYSVTGTEWFAQLSFEPVDVAGELREIHGPKIADIFARVPLSDGLSIPRHQIHQSVTTSH